MVRRLGGLAALAALAACSFLCIPGGNCVDNADCQSTYVCSPKTGTCVPASGASTSSGCGSGSSSGGGSGSSSGSGSGSSSGSGSGSSGTPCAQSGVCCQSAWAIGDRACTGLAIAGSGFNSLYVTTNESPSYGIYQVTPGSATSTLVADVSILGSAVTAFAVVPGSPPTFVVTGSGALGEFSGGTYTSLPQVPSQSNYFYGLGYLQTNGVLALSTFDSLIGESFPPSMSWGMNRWSGNNNAASTYFNFSTGQMVPVGPSGNALVAATGFGAVTLASNGDVCFSQGCLTNSGMPPSASQFPGVAVDPASGITYLVGNDSDAAGTGTKSGVIAATDEGGNVLWVRAGTASSCNVAGALPFTPANCAADASLYGKPLYQAGDVSGTLFVTGLGTGAGGPIYTYSTAAGLQPALTDHPYYYSMAVGP